MKPPYPYFGGKSKIAHEAWRYFGTVNNYCEPFLGSAAVLLARPLPFSGSETVNDINGFICNFYRALQRDCEALCDHAIYPVNEIDHMARNEYLKSQYQSLSEKLIADMDYYDSKIAGYWLWGMGASIGLSYGLGKNYSENALHMGDQGKGIHRSRLHLSRPHGINRRQIDHGTPGTGIREYLHEIASRLFRVRVMCGSWERVVTDSVLRVANPCAVFLDPPYDDKEGVYELGIDSVASEVREWCIAHEHIESLKIILCGYDTFDMPGWRKINWRANHGHQGDSNKDYHTEIMWLSPSIVESQKQLTLF